MKRHLPPFTRLLFPLLFLCCCSNLSAQKGFVKLNNDTTVSGYMRYYTSLDGIQGLEVWKTKTDKHPRRIPFTRMQRYAVGKDTFRVLRQFRPFDDSPAYFELARANVVVRGKVSLYDVAYPNPPPSYGASGTPYYNPIRDPNIANQHIYILERAGTGYRRALSSDKEKLKETLRDFFPDEFMASFEKERKISYRAIPELVRRFNANR